MKELDDLMIANFLYILTRYNKLCRRDLDFALDIFLLKEEYEKCSVLKKLIDIEYYDNDKKSDYDSISEILNMINNFDNDDKEMLKYKIKLLILKNELIDSIDEIESNIKRR